ncbi:MAG: hypothetical protein GF350_11710 [Chitinivibrionales bacterium]|nr:hypothetical protein [Chitinivibrionales bacterium]
MIRIVGGESQDRVVSVKIGEKYFSLQTGNIELCSKLIEGPYPDYKKVIPQENPKHAIIDKASLISSVKRVSVLSNQKTNLVQFNFTENELELVVSNRDIGGEAREIIPVEYSGEEHAIGFNGHYFAEILGIINSKKVRIEMNTQISACLLFPVFDEESEKKAENLFLIMPLRILDEI